ncbi:11545_t:CDS:10 [Rhizophagus irregularis]|nr:11545_t:CDS:10 [Rhizophagus irregularis]
MADEAIESQAAPKRGRGRPRGARKDEVLMTDINRTPEQSRPLLSDINMDLGSEINRPMSPQLSRAPSPTPSLASISSGRRFGSLSHDLPAPGRLASVRTAPTGHYFLSTSSRVTLRGTQKKIFVPTVPEAHRRPQPTITADTITPELFYVEDNEPSGFDSSGRGIDQGRGTRGRGRFMPDLVASGPFAFGSNTNIQPLDTTNVFSTSIIEERKSRTDNAEDFDSFREDPWAPDMLLVEHEKEDTAGILEVFALWSQWLVIFVDLERDRNRSRRTFFSFYPLGKDVTDNEKSKEVKRKLIQFDEENHLLCFQLPTILPEFEPSKRSRMSGSNDRSSQLDKGKGRVADKLGTGSPLTQLPAGQGKGKEREQDNAGDAINCNKPEGQIGRLVIRRSGKMQMILGDFTFDVMSGLDRTFLENAVVIDPSQESVFNLAC